MLQDERIQFEGVFRIGIVGAVVVGGGFSGGFPFALKGEEVFATGGNDGGAFLPHIASWWTEDGGYDEVETLAELGVIECGLD